MTLPLSLTRPCFPKPSLDLFSKFCEDIFDSGVYTQGKYQRKFEREISKLTDYKYALMTSNGTVSLSILLLSNGIKAGDIVLTTSYSFSATASAIYCIGAIPIFVDHQGINLDDTSLSEFISDNCYLSQGLLILNEKILGDYSHNNLHTHSTVKAVVAVDQFGLPLNIKSLYDICSSNNITLIRDSACALGTTIGNQSCLSESSKLNVASSISFHPRKTITTGEGGMVLTNDHSLFSKYRMYANHGNGVEDVLSTPSSNARPSELQAALGLCHLSDIHNIIAKRQSLLNQARSLFDEFSNIFTIAIPIVEQCSWNVQSLPVVFDDPNQAALAVSFLNSGGIFAKIAIKPIYSLPLYSNYTLHTCSKTESLSNRVILLPLHENMTIGDLIYLKSRLLVCFEGQY